MDSTQPVLVLPFLEATKLRSLPEQPLQQIPGATSSLAVGDSSLIGPVGPTLSTLHTVAPTAIQ